MNFTKVTQILANYCFCQIKKKLLEIAIVLEKERIHAILRLTLISEYHNVKNEIRKGRIKKKQIRTSKGI